MKKSFKILIISVFIIICLFALTACDNTLNDAYKKAVDEGFVGTQDEWLSSLTTGKSAYEIAVENGFEGNEAEWIASLTGRDGINGRNGVDGADGANGAAGLNGVDAQSPTIYEIYQATLDEGLVDNFDEFVARYLKINVTNNIEIAANIAMRSVVSVYCSTSAGSGVIYQLDKETGSAYIITNYHVVYDADARANNYIANSINVYLYGMEFGPDLNTTFKQGDLDYSIPAEYVGGSMTYDIAVLKVTNNDILKNNSVVSAIKISNSNNVALGSAAIAIGNPSADGLAATSGIVSVNSEHISMKAVDELTYVAFRVQRTDSAINSGNSGGGLFNSNGELIGIVNAKIISDKIENIGYAIPSNIAIGAAQNIIDNCDGTNLDKIQKAILGVTVRIAESSTVNDDNPLIIKIVNEIVVESFATVSETNPTIVSVAYDAGMRVGDKLIKVQMQSKEYQIDRLYLLSDLLFDAREGETIIITVERTVDGVATIVPLEIGITQKSITEIK